MDASALHRSDSCAPPVSVRAVRVFVLLGYMPDMLVRPRESRTLVFSVAREMAMFDWMVFPVFQKSRTLFGCATHGPAPKNCSHGWVLS
jgi:hypothetical protein